MAIAIQNLWKTFIKDGNRIDALKGIDLDIASAESLALVGVSGAGKSTLVHILGTLDHPTQGRVLYNGVDVFTWPEKRLAAFRNTRIGFVFQFHHLLPEFSGLENVMLPALINGLAKREARKKAEGLLKDVGLGDRMTHKPGELSGGEQQRVAVARALIMAPDILLADEPTGNLDTETGKIIEDLLIDLHRERNVTLIVVTHNQSLARRMSKSVGLRDGRIDARA
ncbi:MAG TPA: ABC transporter ATP-binding protein [Syntrophales bacterium]|nr:ABC transporter ATP-binding protein [Syntrophales bacterium]